MRGSRFTIMCLSLSAGHSADPPGPADDSAVRFTDVTDAAGIHFIAQCGPVGQEMAAGNHGIGLRLFRFRWRRLAGYSVGERQGLGSRAAAIPRRALYRNNHNGTFTDVTNGSGLDIEIYGIGVTIGDYDNDGRDDVYITALGGDHLFHNEGGGHFRDVTRDAGIPNAGFSSSAAWLDYDRDGKLDLFVANYVQWTPQGDLWCSLDGSTKSYCTPESYKGT